MKAKGAVLKFPQLLAQINKLRAITLSQRIFCYLKCGRACITFQLYTLQTLHIMVSAEKTHHHVKKVITTISNQIFNQLQNPSLF